MVAREGVAGDGNGLCVAHNLRRENSHEEVFGALRDADVFLLPSVVADYGDMEGIPASLMEAMALRVITVSTWHSGIPS
ncbi:glycosyltransferase [Novosphingobium chloroacetimidivorans]|uniref:glycosyltransferase n=1 Tax=Novosphingobium chloroacetimidivorans TaxID=1428314 RepID=UPI001610941E